VTDSAVVPSPWLAPFESAQPSLSDRFIRALEAHTAAETHDLAACQRLADQTSDPVIKLLMGLIVEDEQRHHSLLQRMIRRLEEEVEFTPSFNALPVSAPDGAALAAEAVASLRSLIRNEHEGARYVRHLARQESDLYHGLYSVLLETIARDSEKHAHVLRYLLRRLESPTSL
jgi:hypothetical protein